MTALRVVKLAISALWFAGQRGKALLGLGKPRLTILYYHAVRDADRERFARQMQRLANGAALVWADHHGPLAAGKPVVAVTFDDAFRSVRDNALPALEAAQVPATIFVPTGHMGRPPSWAMETSGDRDEIVMSAEELQRLPGELIRLGSHSIDHPRLSRLAESELTDQLVQSRAAVEAIAGHPIDTLAFPYGDHDERVVDRCRRAGYRFVYSVQPEAVDTASAATKRGRTAADPRDWTLEFFLKSRGAYAWMPAASALKSRLRRLKSGRSRPQMPQQA